MKDRRSKTSRKNLGDHVPEALSPEGTTTVATRLPNELVAKIDAARGKQTRSAYVRAILEEFHA